MNHGFTNKTNRWHHENLHVLPKGTGCLSELFSISGYSEQLPGSQALLDTGSWAGVTSPRAVPTTRCL